LGCDVDFEGFFFDFLRASLCGLLSFLTSMAAAAEGGVGGKLAALIGNRVQKKKKKDGERREKEEETREWGTEGMGDGCRRKKGKSERRTDPQHKKKKIGNRVPGPVPVPKFRYPEPDPVCTGSRNLEPVPVPVGPVPGLDPPGPNRDRVQDRGTGFFAHPYSLGHN